MGYSERDCAICGSRFNMARLRRTDEALNMAWDNTRDHWRPGFDPNGDEGEPNAKPIIPKYVNGGIIGYECDGEFCGFYIAAEGIESDSACAATGCNEEYGDHACGGPSCGLLLQTDYQSRGYNGWLIDVEEMKIMTCVQAAVPNERPDEWEPEADDDEFEHCGLILTAVSESCPDEFEVTHVPYRHGIGGKVFISDIELLGDGCGVPFHGPCYQVLKQRARKLGPSLAFNLLDGIVSSMEDAKQGAASEDVRENDDQFWCHIPGTEYLAADPYHVPGLETILQECIGADCVAPDAYAEVLRDSAWMKFEDPFTTLPPELRLLILGLLDYKDVASLRLVSRIFRVLPQKFFRDMTRKRMPWIWELDNTSFSDDRMDWFKLWSKLSQADGGKGRGKRGLAFKLEHPELGRGTRINGLVNRRRVWFEAGLLLEIMMKTQDRSDRSLSTDSEHSIR